MVGHEGAVGSRRSSQLDDLKAGVRERDVPRVDGEKTTVGITN